MTKLQIPVMLLLGGAWLSAAGAAPDDKAKDPLPGVKAQLVISVDEYDPSKPSKGMVKCLLANKSKEPVEVQIGCDKETNRLNGQGKGHRFPVTLQRNKASKEEPKRVRVKPDEEQVLFELSLDDILFQGVKGNPREKDQAWRWEWTARPESPVSPVHGWREPGFVESATFWSEVMVAGKRLSSERTTLKIKPIAKDPK